ncbi:copper chaperone PCu(A)C [Sphingomonas naphthae]|uniref:Copper chaperone PCu(A)C n=1 Tax=Sphingomonas naphthae TaxID=1813468 RepID=A0ABY7TP57_9SPHN|nr:copper chaperone PCu(A)C [Sphingomonas naphthae]WCT74863.1 copper chaperone PCu(A)C [Sphingomonas naphthae]
MKSFATAALIALATLSACHGKAPDNRGVTRAWARLPVVPGRPGAVYFTLVGTGKADRLVGIDSAVVGRIELHESGMHGRMMTMRPLAGADVPAVGKVVFGPSGNHGMLFDIDKAITPGTAIPMRFVFASGRAVEVETKTVEQGGEAPFPAE